MKKLVLIAGLMLGSAVAWGSQKVIIVPTGGPCTVDVFTVPATSTTSWTSRYTLQRVVEFQSLSDTDVYMGFVTSMTTSTGRGFYNKGDTFSVDMTENVKVWFAGDGTGGKMVATYCK